MESFYVVSLESGQLLLKSRYRDGGNECNNETLSIHHSLKLYAIYCQMRAISTTAKGSPFWIRSGAGGISYREDYHQVQVDGQIRHVSAVFILCTRPEVEFEEAAKYFDSLREVYGQHAGSPSAQLHACQSLISDSFAKAKESQKKLKGSIAVNHVRCALTEV